MLGSPSANEPNNGWKFFFATLIMTMAAGLFTGVRLVTRVKTKCTGSDDYAIAASVVFSVVLAVAIITSIKHGYGKHIDHLTDAQAAAALQWFFIAQTPYKVVVGLNKISLLLLYRRIFVQRTYQIACWIMLAIIIGWSVSSIFATILQCVPIEGSWNKSLDATCINKDAFWIAYAVGNILTDVMVLALPVRPVYQLNMPLRQRLLLCGVFLLGGFVTITSILRTTAVSNSLKNQQDITYNFIVRGIWTVVEANTGVICASLPVLKQPIAWLLPRLFGDSNKGGYVYEEGFSNYKGGYRMDAPSRRWRSNANDGSSGGNSLGNARVAHATDQLSTHSDEQVILKAPDAVSTEPSVVDAEGIMKQTRITVRRQPAK